MGIKVEANASYYGGIFSGHIDSKGILGYLKSINIKETVFLVHGTNSSLIDLQNQLIKNVNNKVLIPNKGQKFSIK
jgi:predicted metal-dependent RNase